MKKKIFKLSALLLLASSLSSCNRGVGCPNQFSIAELMNQVLAFLA
jgi:hypothetical protein